MPFITRVDPHVEASATSNAESHGIEDPWLVGKTERIKHERMILPTVSSRFYPFLIRLRNRMCTLLLAAARLWRSPFACVQFAWRSAMRMRIKTRAGCKSSKVCRGIAHARGFRFVIIDPVASESIYSFYRLIDQSLATCSPRIYEFLRLCPAAQIDTRSCRLGLSPSLQMFANMREPEKRRDALPGIGGPDQASPFSLIPPLPISWQCWHTPRFLLASSRRMQRPPRIVRSLRWPQMTGC